MSTAAMFTGKLARITVGEPKDVPVPEIFESSMPEKYFGLKYTGTQIIYPGRVPLPTFGKQHIQKNIIDFDFNGNGNLKMMPVLVKTPAYPSGYPQFIPMGISKTQYVLRGDWSKVRDGSGFKRGQLLHFWVYSYDHLLDKNKMKGDGCDDWVYNFEKAAIEKNPDQLYMPRLCVILVLAYQDGEAAAFGENLEVGESSRGQTGVYSYNHLLDKKKMKMKDGCDWIYNFEKAAIEKNPDQLYMPRLCVILASQDGEAAAAALGENLEVGESSRGQTGDELQDGESHGLSLLSNVCGAFAQESVMPPRGQMGGGEEELKLRNEVADLREQLASIDTRYTNELQFLHQQIDEKNARLRILVQIETAEIVESDETPNA